MKSFFNISLSRTINVLFMLLYVPNYISARRVPVESYYPNGFYQNQEHYTKFNAALEQLEHEPKWVENWPNPSIKMGQVSGVALDNSGLLLVFHRASNTWDATTFNERNVYSAIGESPIPHPTIMIFNDTGELVDMWGQDLFYIPHGITVDVEGNVWLTDVALHQVFKFTPHQRKQPAMVLGEKFIPGDDEEHFCKPSAVAVLSSGEFFVADGYCNTRIIKFAPDGTRILQWGRRFGESPFVLSVPHALALAEARGEVCVADRERGRAACFRSDNGSYVAAYSSWLIGHRLFSLAYSPAHGGRLYIVNGPSGGAPVRGYVLDYDTGKMLATFAPGDGFANPHDIVVTRDGSRLYVAELSPHRVCRFEEQSPANVTERVSPVKPTATLEETGAGAGAGEGAAAGDGEGEGVGAWGALSGALGAALGALGAALLALGALALLRARNRGKKCVARRRWEYGRGEFKLRRLLERRRFTRVHSDDSEDEPAPMLPAHPPANA